MLIFNFIGQTVNKLIENAIIVLKNLKIILIFIKIKLIISP